MVHSVLVGSTIPTYKLADRHECLAWLDDAEERRAVSEVAGITVDHFATLETDARGLHPFAPVTSRLAELHGGWWTFSMDLGDPSISSTTRLPRICGGRNLIIDRALSDPDCTHVLFLDSDLAVPPASVLRLLQLGRPLAGGHVPEYCLDGPPLPWPHRDIRAHWNTAGFLLAQRDVIRRVRWGLDPDSDLTDDPWFARAAEDAGFGETWVDHELVGHHRTLIPLEARGHDLAVRRE